MMARRPPLLPPDEVRDALWLIDVFERWRMPAEEADEWRRRILAQQRFLELRGKSRLAQGQEGVARSSVLLSVGQARPINWAREFTAD